MFSVFLITLNTIGALHLEEQIMMSVYIIKNYPSEFFFSLRQVVFLKAQYSPTRFCESWKLCSFYNFCWSKPLATEEYRWVCSNLEWLKLLRVTASSIANYWNGYFLSLPLFMCSVVQQYWNKFWYKTCPAPTAAKGM